TGAHNGTGGSALGADGDTECGDIPTRLAPDCQPGKLSTIQSESCRRIRDELCPPAAGRSSGQHNSSGAVGAKGPASASATDPQAPDRCRSIQADWPLTRTFLCPARQARVSW